MVNFILSPLALWLGCSIPVALLILILIVLIIRG